MIFMSNQQYQQNGHLLTIPSKKNSISSIKLTILLLSLYAQYGQKKIFYQHRIQVHSPHKTGSSNCVSYKFRFQNKKKKLSSIADGLKATFLNKQLATNIIRKKNNTIKNAMKNVFCYKRRDMCHKRFTSFKIRTNNTKK